MIGFMKQLVIASILIHALSSLGLSQSSTPNVVVMFCDDLGYGDIGSFGAQGYETPNLDRMAEEGVRFTDFYVSSAVCSASRVALLTGCYHERVGISGALGPKSTHGIHEDEVTLAEICKQKGYATAIFGKWHLGHHEKFLPPNHGFDEYFGIPYSNDMWPYHPNVAHLPWEERLKRWPELPLFEGTEIIDAEVSPDDQTILTTQLAERAVDFIERNQDKPFFLYVPHPQPHVPLFVSDKFAGKTENGIYGDVISEIDWSMGQILDKLKEVGVDDNTLVIFTSDNGPWLSYGTHGGSSGPLREGKGTSWDGGVRVPFIARWPGRIPAGSVVSEPAMTIDILPTVAKLIGAELPDHKIDGLDIWPLLSNQPEAKSPHDALFIYYARNQLQSVRSGPWKLILPHKYRTLNGRTGKSDGTPINYEQAEAELGLYDVSKDPGESTNLVDAHPEVVAELLKKVEAMRQDLGDQLTKSKGSGRREPGRL